MKKHIFSRLLSAFLPAILLLFTCTHTVYADALPEPTSQFYVLDEAGVLSSAAEARIVSENQALFALTGAEIAVVCVDTTGTADIADYAYGLFNKWGIGSAERNNGVLLLLSIDEDDYWVLQGEGLEETLTSGMLKLWNNDYLEPHFAAKRYEEGVLSLFDVLVAHFETLYSVDIESWDGAPGEFTPMDAYEEDTDEETDTGDSFILGLIILIVILLVIIALNNRGSGGGGGGGRRYTPVVRPTIVIPPPRGGFYPGGSRPTRGGSFGGSLGGSRGGSFGGSLGGSRGGFSGGGGGRSRGGGAGRR